MPRRSHPAQPAPVSPPYVEPVRRRRSPLVYLFGAIYAGMLIAGFEIGLRAGSPKPTPAKMSTVVAEKKVKPGTKGRVDNLPDETALVVKPKGPATKEDPKKPPMPEAKEPDSKPMPEATPEKKPEPKMEKPEKKPEPKPDPKPQPKPPAKTEPKKNPNPPTVVTFSKIQPIFKDKCVNCHGGADRKGDLDMRDVKAMLKGGENGAGLVPGDAENSLIWQRIEDKDKPMPPRNKPKLTDNEKKLIREWIAGGAK